MFKPGLAPVSKKSSPTEQVAGKLLPALSGLVEDALEKSIDLLCVWRSTLVWANATTPDVSVQPSSIARIYIGSDPRVRRAVPRFHFDLKNGFRPQSGPVRILR